MSDVFEGPVTTGKPELPPGMTEDVLLWSLADLHTKIVMLDGMRVLMARCISLADDLAKATGKTDLWRSAEARWLATGIDLGFYLQDLQALMRVTEDVFPELRSVVHGPDGGCAPPATGAPS